ncbi:MAG: hypothetical protein ACOC44_16505 [Promethearchaeia archaeon]
MPVDKFNMTIHPGDEIVYPGKSGSNIQLFHGIVESIKEDNKLFVRKENGRLVTIYKPNHVVLRQCY